jgi:hypothetical protein
MYGQKKLLSSYVSKKYEKIQVAAIIIAAIIHLPLYQSQEVFIIRELFINSPNIQKVWKMHSRNVNKLKY